MNKQAITTLAFVLSASSALAFIDFTLPGSSVESNWADMTSSNYPAYPGPSFAPVPQSWPAPIAPDSGSAEFNLDFGTAGPFVSSLYNGALDSQFSISQSSPLAGLETVIFQTDMGATFSAVPMLSYNSGAGSLLADYTGIVDGNFEDSFVNAFQWDLSGLGPITDYEIVWTTLAHNANYAMQLTEGDSFAQVIPEPSTYALIFGAAIGGILFVRRMRR